MATRRRIGIVDQTTAGWTAGGSYTEAMIRSLLLAGGDGAFDFIRMTERESAPSALDALPIATHRFASTTREQIDHWLETRIGSRRPLPLRIATRIAARAASMRGRSELMSAAKELGLSAMLPLRSLGAPGPIATVGWIPDFQHVREPQFFSADERTRRDTTFRALATNASKVMLSSQAASDDFVKFAPSRASKARVARFPSTFAFRPLPALRSAPLDAYDLPSRFALVVNQFWQHKNHLTVVDAIGKARDLGAEIVVAMVGVPADYRDPENQVLSQLLQRIVALRLTRQIRVLGKVPYADLVDLLRTAAVVIQPSRFEGWSTTVEDAKALGRPVICSDIDVHREQAPHALGLFGCDDSDRLAKILVEHWPSVEAGGDPTKEAAALATSRESALAFGRSVLSICEEIA